MTIEERHVADVVIIDLSGRIVAGDEAALLRRCIHTALGRGEKKIFLNMAEVPYIDSAAIGELVRAYVAVHRAGGFLKLVSPSRKVIEVLEIVKLTTVFRIFASEAEALVAIAAPKNHLSEMMARAS